MLLYTRVCVFIDEVKILLICYNSTLSAGWTDTKTRVK